jgi:formylglycine-generating enzyme required for sulfatase activity
MDDEIFTYRAFISYRHAEVDRRWAKWFMERLEAYRTPKDIVQLGTPQRVGKLFRDDDEIPASSDLGHQLEDALTASEFLIVICSPRTPGSAWVRKEITFFQGLGRGNKIIPVLVEGEPGESFPHELTQVIRQKTSPDGIEESFVENVEPLAADIRPRSDERALATSHRALIRVASALLRCRFDDLEQRDRKRQQKRRRINIAATASAFVLSITGLAALLFPVQIKRAWAQEVLIARLPDSELATLDHKAIFRECDTALKCPEMVVLAGGRFLMGSPAEEPGRYPDEQFPAEVSVARLSIGRFNVTFEEWEACVAYTDQRLLQAQQEKGLRFVGCAPSNDSGFGSERRPIINTSWDDANGYVAWLNLMIANDPVNGPYRLPTESEWEYAARGDTASPYFWGSEAEMICAYANVMTQEAKKKYPALGPAPDDKPAPCEDGFIETSPVGTYLPNPYGLYDIVGNVWQWLEDCEVSRKLAPGGQTDIAKNPAPGCSRRSLRGGSWRSAPQNMRSARRGFYPDQSRYFDVGFRVARSL